MDDKKHHCSEDSLTDINIEKYGLTVIILEATEYLPAFAYSIGLWKKFKHPEIICFGLTTNTLHLLINDVAAVVKEGVTIETNVKYDDFFEHADTQFITVHPSYYTHHLGTAMNYYNNEQFPVLQFVWTDRYNNFPWEENFESEFKYRQPLLDRNINFKFREDENLAVFATRQWLDFNKPITRVVHEEDGDWQFLTGDQKPEDIRLVALQEVIMKDKTLNEVFDLDYGESAERQSIESPWIRTSYPMMKN